LWGALAGAVVGCWRADLPSVVSADPHPGDAATVPPPPASLEDAARIILAQTADGSASGDAGTGEVALTVSLPVDTATGEVLRVGSLHVRLLSVSGSWSRALWVELPEPPASVSLNLDDVAAGGPYRLDIDAAPQGTAGCAGTSPAFSVLDGQTVRVLEALVCGGDGGLATTLSDPTP
jgi:hypothetical protein